MRSLLAICLVALPGLATAQEVVGRSAIEGRNVTLYTDGTWEYAARGTHGCLEIQIAK